MVNSEATVWNLIQTFLSVRTTSHGFPRCRFGFGMGSIHRRALWLITALLFTGYGSWRIYKDVQFYITNPIITSIDLFQPSELVFPAVTVCSSQPVRPTSPGIYEAMASISRSWYQEKNDTVWESRKIWNILAKYMNEYQKQHDFLKDIKTILGQNPSGNSTTRELVMKLLSGSGIDYSSSIEYLMLLRQIRRIDEHFINKKGEESAWTLGNAGRTYTWLNETWNDKYFDIKNHTDAFKPDESSTFFHWLLTRSKESFQMEIYPSSKNIAFENVAGVVTELRDAVAAFKYMFGLRSSEDERCYHRYGSSANLGTVDPVENMIWKSNLMNQDGYIDRYFHNRVFYPFSFSSDDVIRSCTIDGRTCGGKFYTTIDPFMKTCFHFNSEYVHKGNEGEVPLMLNTTENRKAPILVENIGRDKGLTIKLATRKNTKGFEFLAPSNGYIIAVGDSATMPRLDQQIKIPNTGHADISIQRTEISRLDPDNGGHCASADHFERLFPELKTVGHYDQTICKQLLVFTTILKECRCLMGISITTGIINMAHLMKTHQSCVYDSMPCVEYASIASNQTSNICPPACHEVIFDVFSTTTPYDQEGAAVAGRLEIVDEIFPQAACAFDGDDACRRTDAVTVNVFYRSRIIQALNESLQYTPSTFVGALGNLAALYTGISLLSLFELVELIFDFVVVCLSQRIKRTQVAVMTRNRRNPNESIEKNNVSSFQEMTIRAIEERNEATSEQITDLENEVEARIKKIEMMLCQKGMGN